jgi:hypothetical protein
MALSGAVMTPAGGDMNRLHINSPVSAAGPFGAWWTPRLRGFSIAFAMLLPGSFMVLPLIWLWQRRHLPSACASVVSRIRHKVAIARPGIL